MVKTKQICTEATPEEVEALLRATGMQNTKAALNDAMGYRIKHPLKED